jgi:L-asparagine transporter-like permease
MMRFALSLISIILITVVIIVGMVLTFQHTKENRNGFQSASKVQAAPSGDGSAKEQ